MAGSDVITVDTLLTRLGSQTVSALGLRVVESGSTVVDDITHDSRSVKHGTLFCCVRGERHDGHDFAPQALASGAVALLVDRELVGVTATQIVARDTREAMGHLASAFYDQPSRSLTVVGVTGTNGKTTTAHMLGSIFEQAGQRTTVLGTLTGARTTPEAPELQRTLAQERKNGTSAVVMEVSSHALALKRVAGMHFAAAVFTNLGHDHLDFHGTHDAYFAAKASLFSRVYADRGIVNRDDPYGRKICDGSDVTITTFGRSDASDVHVDSSNSTFMWRNVNVRCAVGGDFNVTNAIAAATTAAELGISTDRIVAGLARLPRIPGRFENVNPEGSFAVLVDYAHTPEAMRNVVAAARQVVGQGASASKRVIVVFGCGGDRDASKRPEMGAAACAADRVIVTSDNSRSEDPQAIVDAIVAGVPAPERGKVVVEIDRRRAIKVACAEAVAGDVVVIAGRGHETVQSIGGREYPFSDAFVARELLEAAR
jgi:UDP-N-acetylmuramoyl-L-alanyl-D-glutamate--2,6-diaminopimelate ligase